MGSSRQGGRGEEVWIMHARLLLAPLFFLVGAAVAWQEQKPVALGEDDKAFASLGKAPGQMPTLQQLADAVPSRLREEIAKKVSHDARAANSALAATIAQDLGKPAPTKADIMAKKVKKAERLAESQAMHTAQEAVRAKQEAADEKLARRQQKKHNEEVAKLQAEQAYHAKSWGDAVNAAELSAINAAKKQCSKKASESCREEAAMAA